MEIGSNDKRDSFIEFQFQVKHQSVWLLRSNYPDRVIEIGSVTGNRYDFPHGGVTLEVDERDASKMLEKVFGGNSCCGSGAKPMPMFSVIS